MASFIYLSARHLNHAIRRQSIVLGGLRGVATEKREQYVAPKRHRFGFSRRSDGVAGEENDVSFTS